MSCFKTVNGVPTKIITFGKNVEDDLSKVKYLVLTIPGEYKSDIIQLQIIRYT